MSRTKRVSNGTMHKRIVALCFVLLQLLVIGISGVHIENGGYNDINVEIMDMEFVRDENCKEILRNLEKSLSDGSTHLYNILHGKFYLASFNIHLPAEWSDKCIPDETSESSPATGGKIDLRLTATHTIYGDHMWTEQYGGCGVAGNVINLPYNSLAKESSGKLFAKEWIKYRYGVFDEHGYPNDEVWPLCYYDDGIKLNNGCVNNETDVQRICSADSSSFTEHMDASLTCASHSPFATNKQNSFCDRKSWSTIIKSNKDFELNSVKDKIIYVQPKFNYKRHTTVRYVVVIDGTAEMSVRESWHFLRTALRKWFVFDLPSTTEVGVIIANGNKTISKSLDLMPMNSSQNRDLVASFIPYIVSDSRDIICLTCALQSARDLLKKRQNLAGKAANVIVVIAPGMDPQTKFKNFKNEDVVWNELHIRLTTINYPYVLPPRVPLDRLNTNVAEELSLSVLERKFNAENSYLSTYFELTNALMHTSRHFDSNGEGTPVELHRHTISDQTKSYAGNAVQRQTALISGQFMVELNYKNVLEFFVYTHSNQVPLIKTMRLMSPSGQIYDSRRDQRMPVKQMLLVAPANVTGMWRYEIERYTGNPQPHIVQVLVRPEKHEMLIKTTAWLTFKNFEQEPYFNVYCKVNLGKYAIIAADVYVKLSFTNSANNTQQVFNIDLLDNGNGDSDLTFGDGIYSRKIGLLGPGVYTFEFFVKGVPKQTYTVTQNISKTMNLNCCAHEINFLRAAKHYEHYFLETGYFERYPQTLTHFVDISHEPNQKAYELLEANTPITTLVAVQDEENIQLSWSAFDFFPTPKESTYEIRYGFKMSDVIEHFNECELLIKKAFSSVNSSQLQYNFSLANYPSMYGQAVYIAVRAFGMGRLSNVVTMEVPAQVFTTPSPINTTTEDVEVVVSDATWEARMKTFLTSPTGVICASAGLLALLLLILLCLLCILMRGRKSSKQKAKLAIENKESVYAKQTDYQPSSYHENLESSQYDHHALGIPTIFSKATTQCGAINLENDHISFGSNVFQHSFSNRNYDENNFICNGNHTCFNSNENSQQFVQSLEENQAPPPVPPLPFHQTAFHHCEDFSYPQPPSTMDAMQQREISEQHIGIPYLIETQFTAPFCYDSLDKMHRNVTMV